MLLELQYLHLLSIHLLRKQKHQSINQYFPMHLFMDKLAADWIVYFDYLNCILNMIIYFRHSYPDSTLLNIFKVFAWNFPSDIEKVILICQLLENFFLNSNFSAVFANLKYFFIRDIIFVFFEADVSLWICIIIFICVYHLVSEFLFVMSV